MVRRFVGSSVRKVRRFAQPYHAASRSVGQPDVFVQRGAAAIASVFVFASSYGIAAAELTRRLEAVPVRGEWTPELARAWWETHQPAPLTPSSSARGTPIPKTGGSRAQ
jgi:hypothetical protein